MIRRYIVKGHSMEPNFNDGDKLLLSSLFFKLKSGDAVVFGSGSRDYLKRIVAATAKNKFIAVGDNKGHSSKYAITRKQVKGKFLMKY